MVALPLTPNGFATIYGLGFTSGPDRLESNKRFADNALGGAKVQIGGKDAFISYASFGQLNILIAPDLPAGSLILTVATPAGSATATVNILMQIPSGSLIRSAVRTGSQA